MNTLTFGSPAKLRASLGPKPLRFVTDAASYRMTVELQAVM